MAEPAELLRAFTIFRGLAPEVLERIPVRRVERDAGELFVDQDDPATSVFGVLTGRVRIDKRSGTSKPLCLDVLGPGEVIAAVAVVRHIPMPASARAVERAACLEISASDFNLLLVQQPLLTARTLDLVCKRMVDSGACRVCLATDPVDVRVAKALLRLAHKFGGDRHGEVAFSQSVTRKDVADLAGTTVESAIRVMSSWTQRGWLKSTGGRLTIVEPSRLRALAVADCDRKAEPAPRAPLRSISSTG
jgi:CRP/FNR family transcriptional regulator